MKKVDNRLTIRRADDQVEVWFPPVGEPEGEVLMSCHTAYIPELIALLKNFEQTEGR